MIEEKEFQRRRKKLAKSLKVNSIAIFLSASYQTRSNDTEFPFRQNSNFYYLTGFKEDNAALVIIRGKKAIQTYLFVQKKEKELELWSGKRLGQSMAKERFHVDAVFTSSEFEKRVSALFSKKQNLYIDFKCEDKRLDFLREKNKGMSAIYNAATLVEKLRLIKSKAEIALIKKALSITQEAHHRAITISKTLQYEYELQAEIEYIFKKNGAYSDAYTSIVACGNAANTLHYISNDKKLKEGALILIDAGCEYDYYASDITRTIPVNQKFSEAQKDIYSLVLEVEKKIISMVKPGVLRSHLQSRAEELLTQGLVSLDILKGEPQKLIKKQKHKKYYPHGIGHWMGLDVHDACPYSDATQKELTLMDGMVLTIEPGIYIDKNDKSVPKKYRGIGIRIEDDILVTCDGYENLSVGIKKEIKEIESL